MMANAIIALEEWSGPVSPRFQYRVTLRLTDLELDYEETGALALGPAHAVMTKEASDALWHALEEAKVFTCGGDLVDPKKVGVSFNRCSVTRGTDAMTLQYTLSQLDDPPNANRKSVIAAIKKAARAAAESKKAP